MVTAISCLLSGYTPETGHVEIKLTPGISLLAKTQPAIGYEQLKASIRQRGREFFQQYPEKVSQLPDTALAEITAFWTGMIGRDLFKQWEGTPWDYNGTTSVPKKGKIACGYFVTAMLADMGIQLNRRKLATCASSEMMRQLVPGQAFLNLSGLSPGKFCDELSSNKPGVYLIGLDYHTGLVVADGHAVWFIHSYFARNIGVIKENALHSPSLQSSNTKWLVSLTADRVFLRKWLNGFGEQQ